MVTELLEQLDPEQRAAVTLPSCHALVLAGAGSGKTRVLTHRIAWLIAHEGVAPGSILAVTFTNKAAKEMRGRLAQLVDADAVDVQRGVWLGTFHGIAHRMLRRHAADAGLSPSFQILDASDQLALAKRVLKQWAIPESQVAPRELVSFINAHKERGERLSAITPQGARGELLVNLWQAYETLCAREGVVDFAELILRSLELLERNEPLRSAYRARFAHVLVDEFQDTNPLQYRWLQTLACDVSTGEAGAWLFCVGDDDQSIYGFRGAMSALLERFHRDYRAELVRLERNYRSVGNILAAANAIIANNRARLGKTLRTDRGEGELIRTFEGSDEGHEAQFVVDEIAALMRDGWSADEIAILYRTNAMSRLFEHHLLAAGIPYRVYGGLRFFDRAEIKHTLAYLRLLVLPEDTNALLRVVNVPARGIGSKTVEQLLAAANSCGSWEEGAKRLTGRGGAAVQRFAELIQTLRDETATLALPDAIARVIDRSGLRAFYEAEENRTVREERLENLAALVDAGHEFVTEMAREGVGLTGHEMIALFLQHAALESGEMQADERARAVQLMTVHAAKGLEFDAVFLVGLEEGVFPHENALADVAHHHSALEEERRLMYVAVTRAKKRLTLTWAASRLWHGATRYRPVSRFVAEIPESLLLPLSGRRGAQAVSSLRQAPVEPFAVRSAAGHGTPSSWWPGQSVRHPKFGEGVIVALEGSGAQQQATVRFGPQVGVKRLLLSVARLERV
ncbi:UvrD-helicase domain-containing protein [Hydrogenophilus islandicus]